MHKQHPHTFEPQRAVDDMAKGFGSFVDRILRGREDKTILNASVGLAALEVGVKTASSNEELRWEFFPALVNNRNMDTVNFFSEESTHKLFDLNPENFTLFGLDFPDFFGQFAGKASEHGVPLYEGTVAESIGLPDLPYGEIAHFAHMGMALYDTGRTFQDLWNDPALEHNVLKIITHPEMGHTLAHKGVMLTVMGLLHPLGPVVSIGVAYLCGHLVHSFFQLLDNHREAFQEMQKVPVLREVYNATGIKEWAEAKSEEQPVPAEEDPYQESWERRPRNEVEGDKEHERLRIFTERGLLAS